MKKTLIALFVVVSPLFLSSCYVTSYPANYYTTSYSPGYYYSTRYSPVYYSGWNNNWRYSGGLGYWGGRGYYGGLHGGYGRWR